MRRKYLNAVVAALAMLGVLGLAACGGDDNGDAGDNPSDNAADNGNQDGDANDNGTDSADGNGNGTDDGATGGNGGDSGNGGAGAGGGADEGYVRTMCNVVSDFQQETMEATQDLDPEATEEEVVEAVASSFRNLADTAAEVDPPQDLAEAHEQMVSSMQSAADTLESGEEGAMQEIQNVQLDPQIQQRMFETGQSLEACEDLFAAPGGGGSPGRAASGRWRTLPAAARTRHPEGTGGEGGRALASGSAGARSRAPDVAPPLCLGARLLERR
ncbi:MAG: hypothetical protein U5Q44_04630 [Dehalococcoidia bacterium]|nr:hypothetical protein [Dehalococcoidia bacterium]